MLGGRRENVTKAAGRLQQAGLIRYVRGTSLSSTVRDWRRQAANVIKSSKPSSTGCSARDAPHALGDDNDLAANPSPVFGVLAIIELGNAG
jgi:hypothetical protein